jgi:hypothetical protein
MSTQGNFYAASHLPMATANGSVHAAVLGSDDTSNLSKRGSFFEQRGSDHWGQNGVCHAKWSDIPENAPEYRTTSGELYALNYEGWARKGWNENQTLHWSQKGVSISLWLTGPWGYPKPNYWTFELFVDQQVKGDRWYRSSTWLSLQDRDGSGAIRYFYNFPKGLGEALVPGWGQLTGRWPRGGGSPEYWWRMYSEFILNASKRAVEKYPPTQANVTLTRVSAEVIEYPAPDTRTFLFGESTWNDVWSRVEHHDVFEMLKEGCYLNAVQSIPRLSQNSIQNLLEVVSFISDIKSGALKLAVDDVPTSVKTKYIKTTVSGRDVRSSTQGQLRAHTRKVNAKLKKESVHYGRALKEAAGDSWLQYRYAYGTTTMDFQEALNFVQRKRDLTKVHEFSIYGSSGMRVEGRDVTMRCRIPVINHMDSAAHNMWDTLYVYGLQPDLYILWDMIPYSFIVDWALPIGDFAAAIDTMNNLNSSYWSLGTPTYSLKYMSGQNNTVSCYTRWVGTAPPMLLNGVWANQGVSYRTMAKRGADVVSLII